MTILHDFHLLPSKHYEPLDYRNWPPRSQGVQLDDDLLSYMWDALAWVPCRYPHSNMKRALGPDRYGPTVVDWEGALPLSRVLDGFADVFATGPNTLRLNCGPAWIETGNPADNTAESMFGNYVEYERDETIDRLRQIAAAARTIVQAPDDWFLAIRGI